MAHQKSTAQTRLTQIKDFPAGQKTAFAIPWDPNATKFPTRHQLPKIAGAPDQAAWVWGSDDSIGRLNLLTPTRVAAAGKEIRTGEIVPVNLPLNVPETPAFGREPFRHEIKAVFENYVYDDIHHLNTQSSTQWDGFRHFSHLPTASFYNGTKASDILGPNANQKCGIHHWANHGIAGRGVLLDYRGYAETQGIRYDPFDSHSISHDELVRCGLWQGLDIRPQAQGGDIKVGDILFVRVGWCQQFRLKSPEERRRLALRKHEHEHSEQKFAGLAQEERILDWLHDCYFAAVAGDSPTFEAWPTRKEYHLHEYILALWGMPLGEMLDLERLAATCKEKKRYTFFFSSTPANVPGGVSSPVNGQAVF